MSGIPLITEQSSVEEVQTWFKTYEEGQFSDFASMFKRLKGKDMLGLSKEDLNNNLGFPHGIALYNALHPPLPEPKGTPQLQLVILSLFLVI